MSAQPLRPAFLLVLFTCIKSLLALDQNISTVTECSTWHIFVDGKCVCGGGAIKCLPDGQVAIRPETCLTYTDEQLFLGDCPYTANSTPEIYLDYITLPSNISKLNEFMCGGRNRMGLFCSQCRDNLTLAALSYTRECIECSDADVRKGIVLFLVLAFIPTTAFFLLVMLCMRDITSGPTNAVLIIIQITMAKVNLAPVGIILSSASNYPMHYIVIVILSILGIFFNLDFLRYVIPPFCISKSLTFLQAQLLEYAIAVYPLLILAVTYIFVELHDRGNCIIATLWKPFRKVSRLKCLQHLNIKYSLIITFATFLLLSYTRILFISAGILQYSNVHNITGKVRKVLLADASVTYLSPNHIPYLVLAIFILLIFNLIPLLLLFFYPTKCFQHFLGCFPNVNWHPLRAFMDIFQGCYKNGTDGTRDYRYFSALNFVLRIFSLYPTIRTTLQTVMVPLIFSYMLLMMRPYQRSVLNYWESFVFFLYALIHLVSYIGYSHLFNISFYSFMAFLLLYLGLLRVINIGKTLFPGCYARCLEKAENSNVLKWFLSSKSDMEKGVDESHEEDEDLPDRINNPQDYASQ